MSERTFIAGADIGTPENPCVAVYIGSDGKAYPSRPRQEPPPDEAEAPVIADRTPEQPT